MCARWRERARWRRRRGRRPIQRGLGRSGPHLGDAVRSVYLGAGSVRDYGRPTNIDIDGGEPRFIE
jgi:hypothetical protein